MTYKYEVEDSAKLELRAIVSYLNAATGNTSASKKLIETHKEKVRLVRENPEMYQLCNEPNLTVLGYRKCSFEKYLFLYTCRGDCIYIAHYFHQRQDYARLV